MALFKSLKTKTTTGDPFLDAVVSMVSDDNTEYTSIKALRNSDVFTAVRIIASDIASSPIQELIKGMPQEKSDISQLLNVEPNELMDGWHFKFALAANMLLNGNSYAEIEREGTTVTSLNFIPNSQMSLKQEKSGKLIYEVKQDETTRKLDASDVLHFKFYSQDGLTGMSPLYSLKDEMKVQSAGNKTLYNFFKRGVNGSGILKVNKSDLDVNAKEAIRNKFEEANGSSAGENALRTIILDDSMEYKALEINTDVLRLVNSSDWQTKQIAKAFGIDTERLGVEQQHSSTIQSNLMYIQNTLTHYFSAFLAEINKKIVKSDGETSLRFNTDRLLESDPQAVLETTIKSVQGSLLTVNEGRAKLGLSPMDGGDRLLASLNYTHLDNLDKYQFREENVGNGEGTGKEIDPGSET